MKLLIALLMLASLNAFAQFKNETELGLLQSGGNSDIQTNNAKTTSNYKWDMNTINFGGHYTYGETSDAVTARNWDLTTSYERQVSDKLSLLLGEVVEGNRFIGIKSRYNSDIGIKYFYMKDDKRIFFTELGYRYSIEDRYEPLENTYDNKARLYNEFSHVFSETTQYKFWLEYVPNFTDGKDYLINGEASLTAILNSTFSLKVAYKGMYDNQPAFAGFKNYDFLTTTALVAKF